MPFLERENISQSRVRMNGDRIDHHPRLEPLDLSDMVGLCRRIEILVNHPEAARLRHRDRKFRFGHRVHGRGNNGNRNLDVAGDTRASRYFRGEHGRCTRFHQHVIECKIFGNVTRGHQPTLLSQSSYNLVRVGKGL